MVAFEYHPVPEWLNEDYLENVLKKYKKDKSLKVKNLEIKPATSKGENYASLMTRVKIAFQQGDSKDILEESLIVKTSLENDPKLTKIMEQYQPYKTEMVMYEKVLPQLSLLLEEIGEKDKLFAGTIHVDYDHSAIIFEDLSVTDFLIYDRLKGMDEEHAKLALRKLAKMHAAAAVFNEREPGLLTKFNRGAFNRYTRGFANFFEGTLTVAAEFAGNTPELGPYYQKKLSKLKEKIMEYGERVFDVKKGFFNTLNHGDFWVNNIMIRYNKDQSGQVIDSKLIDFQFCTWTSPAIDLYFFMNTSLQAELRFERYEELIKYYYDILVGILKELKFRGYIPTLHEFWVQMEANRFYAVISSLVDGPMVINDVTEDADFLSLVEDNEKGRRFKKGLYKNKNTQEYVKRLLPVFNNRGLLDVVD